MPAVNLGGVARRTVRSVVFVVIFQAAIVAFMWWLVPGSLTLECSHTSLDAHAMYLRLFEHYGVLVMYRPVAKHSGGVHPFDWQDARDFAECISHKEPRSARVPLFGHAPELAIGIEQARSLWSSDCIPAIRPRSAPGLVLLRMDRNQACIACILPLFLVTACYSWRRRRLRRMRSANDECSCHSDHSTVENMLVQRPSSDAPVDRSDTTRSARLCVRALRICKVAVTGARHVALVSSIQLITFAFVWWLWPNLLRIEYTHTITDVNAIHIRLSRSSGVLVNYCPQSRRFDGTYRLDHSVEPIPKPDS
jgi:hypothetical protein